MASVDPSGRVGLCCCNNTSYRMLGHSRATAMKRNPLSRNYLALASTTKFERDTLFSVHELNIVNLFSYYEKDNYQNLIMHEKYNKNKFFFKPVVLPPVATNATFCLKTNLKIIKRIALQRNKNRYFDCQYKKLVIKLLKSRTMQKN